MGEEADIIGLECNDLLAGDNADDGLNAKGEDIDWRVRLSASLLEAVEDTMRYCAIHFLIPLQRSSLWQVPDHSGNGLLSRKSRYLRLICPGNSRV